jgi:cytochrome P450
MRKDVLKFMLNVRNEFGDVARVRIGPITMHLISHPKDIKYILASQKNYNKDHRVSKMIGMISGESMLVTSGDVWKKRRRLMQPSFHPNQFDHFVTLMANTAVEAVARWRKRSHSTDVMDMDFEMMALTYTIVEKAFFSTSPGNDLNEIGIAMTTVLDHVYRRMENPFSPPQFVPTPANLRFTKHLDILNTHVYELIEEHKNKDTYDDLLAILIAARDEETREALSSEELRNEAITLMMAGHETTANSLMWFWYVLSQHPDVTIKVYDEIERVLAGRTPTVADLSNLTYTWMVYQETLRLYPPIWGIIRRVLSDDDIQGYFIPKDSQIIISPYVTHRHPDFWTNPETLDPERFHPDRVNDIDKHLYMPFGAGPRFCLGYHFAKLEALTIIATLVQRCHFDLVKDHPVVLNPGVALRAKHGIKMMTSFI